MRPFLLIVFISIATLISSFEDLENSLSKGDLDILAGAGAVAEGCTPEMQAKQLCRIHWSDEDQDVQKKDGSTSAAVETKKRFCGYGWVEVCCIDGFYPPYALGCIISESSLIIALDVPSNIKRVFS